MTINQAIARVDALRENLMPTDIKVGWLLDVDRMIYEEIIKGREGEADVPYPNYTEDDGGRELIVPPPYDMLYVYRLEAEILYTLNEIKKQANALMRYNELLSGFAAKYMREHRALPHAPVIYY